MASKDGIFKSPIARDPSEVPDISLGDYLMNCIRNNLQRTKEQTWMYDVLADKSIKFDEIEDLSKRFGSALTRLGFAKGDILFYVTFDASMLFIINLTVWRLGGITKGWYQYELPEFYSTLMKQNRIKFVLIDKHTAPVMLKAISDLSWSVNLLTFDNLDGAISVNEMLQDDGTAFPQHVPINPRKDVAVIMSTSGTTGQPKSILHSHYNLIALNCCYHEKYFSDNTSVLSIVGNFTAQCFAMMVESLYCGGTIYHLSKFDKHSFFDHVNKFKPEMVILYPATGLWFARAPQLKLNNLSFLKTIRFGASVLDPGIVQYIREALPHVRIEQHYGQSETFPISSTRLGPDPRYPLVVINKQGGNLIVSTGKLFPYVEAKVMDVDTRVILPPGEPGEILVRTPYFMLGYFRDEKVFCDIIDEDGWICTGDLGFIDCDGNMFIIERLSTYFKYNAYPVVPTEIEAVLHKHEAVEGVGVVGIPNVETDNLACAFVVLRPGFDASAEEFQNYVAERLPDVKHLHGGVRFISALPMNRSGKLDRIALRKLAMDNK